MKIELRKYFWAFTLLTIAVCAFFAANAASVLVGAALPEAQQRVRPLGTGLARPATSGAARDVSQILARNIFCSTCEVAGEVRTSEASEDQQQHDGAPVRSTLALRLIATLVSEDDSAWSYAALMEAESQRTRLYAIGGKIPGDATIEDILDRRVIVRNGGRAEYIDLEREGGEGGAPTASAEPVPVPSPSLGAAPPDLIGGVRALGPNKWEIQRSALNKVLGNTTLLARSARIVPSVRNGKPNGFRLYAVRPGSIYSLIGLQNGDTVHAINGHEINTPDKALEIYTKVRNASYLTISFSRGSTTKTHDYVIR